MSRIIIAAILAGSLCSAAAQANEASFSTPSKNIYCAYGEYEGTSSVRCDIVSFVPTGQQRPAGCDLDWGDSFSIAATDQKGEMVCHGDTVISPGAATLPYGRHLDLHGIACMSETSGMTCRNSGGHGFFISRAKQRVF